MSLARWVLGLSLGVVGLGCGGPPPPEPTVAVADVIRGGFTTTRGSREEPVTGEARVEKGATVATGAEGRGSLRLDDGAFVLFDHATKARVDLTDLHLDTGRLWVDASSADETTVETGQGTLRAKDATLAVALVKGRTRVYCGSGEITYHPEHGGKDGRLEQGETLVLGGGAPVKKPAALWDDWTGGLADPSPVRAFGPTYVGALAGRRVDAWGRARTALPVRAHDVTATIHGNLATTQVVQTFFNAQSDVVDAEYTVRLPHGAIVKDFAIDLGSGFVPAQVAALGSGQGYELSWVDPTQTTNRLVYDGPDRLRARIFPVAPGATVRVRMTYAQWLDRRGGMRTYVYPMNAGTEPPLLGELSIEVSAPDAKLTGFRAGMGARVEHDKVVLRASDFRPRADFWLDLVDEQPPPTDVAHAWVVDAPEDAQAASGNAKYVMVDVPTEGIDSDDDDAKPPPLDLVVLLDDSGATDPEDLTLARSVVASVLRQLLPTDRVSLRLADVTAHPPPGAPSGLVTASAHAKKQILDSIARVTPGGATDLGESLRQAAALVAGRPRAAVLYLGDGLPTTGAMDAGSLHRVLGTLDAPPRFFALGIGDGANVDLLRTLFHGEATPVRDRTEASRAVMRVLAEAARRTLRGVHVDLGEGVERVYPEAPLAIDDGAHLRLVGRLRDDLPKKIVVRGVRDGKRFTAHLKLKVGRLDDGGDIRRRWASDRLADLLDQDAGREALVELGVRFGILTPWTSFVVGSSTGQSYQPVRGFDHDPMAVDWGLGGRGPRVEAEPLGAEQGWRRRMPHTEAPPPSMAEQTWVDHIASAPADEAGAHAAAASRTGDGGLAKVAVERALDKGGRGPRGCYDQRLVVRPDLSGQVAVQVEVDGQGGVKNASVVSSTLGDADVSQCVLTEVRGLPFPATGAAQPVTVVHTFVFAMPGRQLGVGRHCSDASRQSLEVRDTLWRERLEANAGVQGALSVWREAEGSCELGDFRARRTLLDRMLRHVGGVAAQVQLYRAFGPFSSVAAYLRRAILRHVRTPEDVMAVRAGLGLDVPVDWSVFARLWKADTSPEARLRLVRRWLDVIPEDIDLRVRLLSLLEQTKKIGEAKRLARSLHRDPLADARVLTDVGEFWLRQHDQGEARRVFSDMVERAPLDPWARRRLGDVYRAHGWADDAYREYATLARLRADDPSTLLLLARAAADAGRVDEALRLEQRLSESGDDGDAEGAPEWARLWTEVRLARLRAGAHDAAALHAIERRERTTGALRDPPALFAALTWKHPDDFPTLWVRYPSTPEDVKWEQAPLRGDPFGIEVVQAHEREDGDYLFEVRRADKDAIRDTRAELLVVIAPGTPGEKVLRKAVTLTRDTRTVRLRLTPSGALETVPAT